MTSFDLNEMSHEFGRVLAEEVAPEEVFFYDEVIAASSKPYRKHRDADLAFGVSVEGVALPVFLAMVGKMVVSQIWAAAQPTIESLAREAAEEARKVLLDRLKNWIARKLSGPPPVRLNDHAIGELVLSVERSAAENAISTIVRDSIVAHIRSFQQKPNT